MIIKQLDIELQDYCYFPKVILLICCYEHIILISNKLALTFNITNVSSLYIDHVAKKHWECSESNEMNCFDVIMTKL
jgi:hypothetical protein